MEGHQSWGWTNPDAPQIEQPPSGPTRRQVGLVAAATLLLAAGFLAFTVLGSTGGGGGKLNPIAQAAERTAAYPGERVSITGSYTSPMLPQPVQMYGGGAFNGETQQAKVHLAVNAPESVGSFSMTELIDGNDSYLSSPDFAGKLPAGKTWVHVGPSSGDSSTVGADESDPRQQLKSLALVSDGIAAVATEPVRGHSTTHYTAAISYAKQADLMRAQGDDSGADDLEKSADQSGSSNFPVDVWIDDHALVRRMTISIPLPIDGDSPVTMSMTMEFFNFGAKPKITLPPEYQVLDAADAPEELQSLTD